MFLTSCDVDVSFNTSNNKFICFLSSSNFSDIGMSTKSLTTFNKLANPSTALCKDLPRTDSVKLISKPSNAEFNLLKAPSKLSPTIAAILSAAPFEFTIASLNAKVESVFEIICSKAAACLKSTTSIILAILPPSSTNLFIAGIN